MRKLVILIIIITIFVTMVGCSYEDINRVLFVTAVLIDVNGEGGVIVYIELFHSYRSNQTNSEMGQRLIYKEEASTIAEAFDRINKSSSQRLVFSQNKVVLFTEKAVEHGIERFWDFLIRDQEMLLRPYVAVVMGDPEEFMRIEIKQNEFVGLFLFDIFDRPLSFLVPKHRQIYEIINMREMGKNVVYLTTIKPVKGSFQDAIAKDNYAILKDDKLATYITDMAEMAGMTFLLDTVNEGMINIPHPDYEDKLAVVRVLKSKTQTALSYSEGEIILRKVINVKLTLDASQVGIVLDDTTIARIQTITENVIRDKCLLTFYRFKEEGLDIFDVEQGFKRRYPNYDLENAIEHTELEVEVRVFLEGSPVLTDFNTQKRAN